MKKLSHDNPKEINSKGEEQVIFKNIKLTPRKISIKEGKFLNFIFLNMGIGKNNFIGFQEEQRLLEELRKELEELKKDMEKTTKKKKELLSPKVYEKKKKEINEENVRQIFAEEFLKMKAIIIDEIKGLFQKEKEKIESQLNQINEELIKINERLKTCNERLKTCEDEINQLKVQLKGNGKNNESNNLH